MKRVALTLPLLLLAACVVRQYSYPPGYEPPPPQPVAVAVAPAPAPAPAPVAAPLQVWYAGPHFVPDAYGGGWCYEEGAHFHDYYPDRPDVYVVENGYYAYRGPWEFLYVDGHPLPGGGWKSWTWFPWAKHHAPPGSGWPSTYRNSHGPRYA